jgi:hypothetical protein
LRQSQCRKSVASKCCCSHYSIDGFVSGAQGSAVLLKTIIRLDVATGGHASKFRTIARKSSGVMSAWSTRQVFDTPTKVPVAQKRRSLGIRGWVPPVQMLLWTTSSAFDRTASELRE